MLVAPPVNNVSNIPLPNIPAKDASEAIQIGTGAKAPAKPNPAQPMLQNRYNEQGDDTNKDLFSSLSNIYAEGPSYADYGQAIMSSAVGQPMTGGMAFDARIKDRLAALKDAQYATMYGMGGRSTSGAIDTAAKQIMADNPNMTYTDAYLLAKSGIGQGRTINASGQVVTLPGYGESLADVAGKEGFAGSMGKAAGNMVVDNIKASGAIDAINKGIVNAMSIAQRGNFAGRLNSKISDLTGDPDYDQFVRQINNLIPIMRVASEFPASGFSDADAAMLQKSLGTPDMTLGALQNIFNDIISEGKAKQARFKQIEAEFNAKYNTGNAPSANNAPFTFTNEAEAEAAGLPKGTVVIINGRKARID